jgi:hypothetical protein
MDEHVASELDDSAQPETRGTHVLRDLVAAGLPLASAMWNTACLSREQDEKGQIASIGNVRLVRQKGGQMAFASSVIGGLLLLGYCVSRVKANRERKKKSVQTLFDTK